MQQIYVIKNILFIFDFGEKIWNDQKKQKDMCFIVLLLSSVILF